MKIRVLGSAAGGGFPQWNCNCRNCRGVRDGTVRARARTQSSLAVCGEGSAAWTLVNASPDILQQLHANADLQPARALRDSALRAIVLMDAQIDHVTGLLMLREADRAWPVYCTDAVRDELTDELPLLEVLAHYCKVERRRIVVEDAEFLIAEASGIRWRALPLQSKAPPYSRDRITPREGSNIALAMRDETSGGRVLYAPGLGEMDAAVWEEMRRADLVLIDGTCWTDDELPRLGAGSRRARDMGHLPLHGEGGMIEWLDRLPPATRKVLVHVNNTNPILDEDSAERALLRERGIEVAHDGMEWDL